MNILDMLKEKIAQCGGDGLVNGAAECGCTIEDLAPCGEICDDCELARKEDTPGGEFDFVMWAMKRKDVPPAPLAGEG